MRSAATGVLFLLLTAISVATASPAGACSCAAATDDEALEMADVVFVGDLVDHAVPSRIESSRDAALWTFEVDAVFKGDADQVQVVASAVSGSSCGLEIAEEGRFLVFARAEAFDGFDPEVDGPALFADLCGGTRALGAAPPASFGDGEAPATADLAAVHEPTATSASDDRWSSAVLLVAALLAVAAVAGGVVVVRRRAGQR